MCGLSADRFMVMSRVRQQGETRLYGVIGCMSFASDHVDDRNSPCIHVIFPSVSGSFTVRLGIRHVRHFLFNMLVNFTLQTINLVINPRYNNIVLFLIIKYYMLMCEIGCR